MSQIILFTTLLFFLLSFVKPSIFKMVLSLLLPFVVIIQLASFITSGNYFDYQAYFHFNLHSIHQYIFLYKKEVAQLSLVYLFILFIYSKSHLISEVTKAFRPVAVLVLLLLITLPTKSIGNVTYNLTQNLLVGSDTFDEPSNFNNALADLGFKNYILPNKLESKSGKNIIVISMESLELGFIENYPDITPNLNNLTENWTFYNDMPQGPGAGWTAGSMYAVQAGLPAMFGMQGNNIFQGVTDKKITTIGDVLINAGYKVDYIMGNISFAGSSDFLQLSNINTIDQNNSLGIYPSHIWGLGDLDLFNEAKLQISNTNPGEPFALFLYTINGHYPNGIYDERMNEFIQNKSKDIDFSVQALDFLVGDFLSFLENKNLLDNTSIFIFPDHKMMGKNKILDTFSHQGEPYRGLYFITNEPSKKLNKAKYLTVFQYEIPRLILNGAGVKSNAKFASDYIKSDMINFVKDNSNTLTKLNLYGFEKKSYVDGVDIYIDKNSLILSTDDFKDYIDITSLKGDGFVEVALDRYITNRGYSIGANVNLNNVPFALRVVIHENKVNKVHLGYKNRLGVIKSGEVVSFNRDEMQHLVSSLDVKIR